MNDVTKGSGVPAFELADLEGRRIRFEPASPGFKLLLFYKHSCPTCQLALPYFDRLCALARGAWSYAISQDSRTEAQEIAARFRLSVGQLVDERPHAVSRLYGIMNVPTFLLVDSTGRRRLDSPAFVKAHFLSALALLSPGADPALLFPPHAEVPELKPG